MLHAESQSKQQVNKVSVYRSCKQNGNTIIEADEKYGDPFLAYLKERIPSLEVIGDVMITESDYFDWVKKLQKMHNSVKKTRACYEKGRRKDKCNAHT